MQSADQFLKNGCDNCEPYLRLKHNREAINECTSQNFDGLVCVLVFVSSHMYTTLLDGVRKTCMSVMQQSCDN